VKKTREQKQQMPHGKLRHKIETQLKKWKHTVLQMREKKAATRSSGAKSITDLC
jgi:hypothetical protein